jgi:NADPH2:quinone reductase
MTDRVLAVRIHAFGGPEALTPEEIELPRPGPGEARVRHQAVGVNFIDVYHRSGLYPRPLPLIPGEEGAGVVEAVGRGVTDVRPGDRVVGLGTGAYCAARNWPAERLTKLPASLSSVEAASVFMKGLTADMLLNAIAQVKAGQTLLVHAAAGGMGQILTRWASSMGCEVIGTVGAPEKARAAKAVGAAHTILYREENVAERVKALTGGKGAHAVFDAVGKATQQASLDSVAPRGWYITYGNASGPPDPVSPRDLLIRGSLKMTRPSVTHYTTERAEREASAARLFDAVAKGWVKPEVGRTWPLREAAEAHRALEGRETTGGLVLSV